MDTDGSESFLVTTTKNTSLCQIIGKKSIHDKNARNICLENISKKMCMDHVGTKTRSQDQIKETKQNC